MTAPSPITAAAVPVVASTAGKVWIGSTPEGADIEADGSFVGTTPSTVELSPGEHQITLKKAGYQDWQRKMKIMNGDIRVAAELEKK